MAGRWRRCQVQYVGYRKFVDALQEDEEDAFMNISLATPTTMG